MGDWVWLKLQPYMQQLVNIRVNHKLASKIYEPFQIVAAIRVVAFKLQLPAEVLMLRYMMCFMFPNSRLSMEPFLWLLTFLSGSRVRRLLRCINLLDKKGVQVPKSGSSAIFCSMGEFFSY